MRLSNSRNRNMTSQPRAGQHQDFEDTLIESTAVLGAPDPDDVVKPKATESQKPQKQPGSESRPDKR